MAILFQSDWARYPTATVHYETRNKSWLRMAQLYQQMGVKNHAWMLALIDPDLRHVDPHDPNLSDELQAKIALECKINEPYFYREVARCPVQGGDPVPLTANRANLSFIWCTMTGVTYLLIQIRQTGKSLIAALKETYLAEIGCLNTEINQLTQNETLRSKTMRTVKECMDALPWYLDSRNKRLDANNTEVITVKALGNSLKMHLSSASEKQANKVGRGLTSPWLLTDEFAFVENVRIALDAAMPTMIAARTAAKKAGTPYGIAFMTTAGKKDDRDGRQAYQFLQECLPWTEFLYDCLDEADLHKTIEMNNRSRSLDLGLEGDGGRVQVAGVFNHRQLGYSDEWLAEIAKVLNLSGEAADRDLFNVWTDGSNTSPFPVHLGKLIRSSEKEPEHVEISPDRFLLRWYIPKDQIDAVMNNGQFIMSLDISSAIGRDDISLVIRNTEDGATVADGTYNMLLLPKFTAWVCSLIVKYRNVLTIIENRSQGQYVLDHLIELLLAHGEDPFKRLFNWVVQEKGQYPERFALIDQSIYARPAGIYEQMKRYFGFTTSGSGETSRDDLYTNTLMHSLEKTGHVMRSPQLIKQTLALVYRNGRIDHPTGGHDDLVIGWLIAHWYILRAVNIDFYGHSHRRVLNKLNVKTNQTVEERYMDYEQAQLREKIAGIYEKLQGERDDWIAMKLEQELRMLDRNVRQQDEEIFSMDALIQRAREIRHQRRRQPQQHRRHGIESRPIHGSFGSFSDQPLTLRDAVRRR